MPARRGSLPLEPLREAVAKKVEARSLRQVAREVGMSPTGLQKFLAGATPYSATRRKLERWYVRETAGYGGDLTVGSALAALRVLVQDLPPRDQPGALTELVSLLEKVYRIQERAAPPWLRELRSLIEREAGGAGTEPEDSPGRRGA